MTAGYWTLGAGYVASTLGGAILVGLHANEGAYALIPVGGSFAALTGHPSCSDGSDCVSGALAMGAAAGLLVLGGVAQTTGGILLLAAPSEQQTVFDPPASTSMLLPMPIFGNGVAGLGISGRF